MPAMRKMTEAEVKKAEKHESASLKKGHVMSKDEHKMCAETNTAKFDDRCK